MTPPRRTPIRPPSSAPDDAAPRDAAPDDAVPEIGVGLLGYAFMGRAHVNALRKLPYTVVPPPFRPRLVAVAGRDVDAVRAAARRYGFERATTDWRDVVADPAVELFDNGGPNDQHREPTIAAARAGKHVLCEKPLGRTADEAYAIWSAVAATGVKHLTGFNYRFLPAVRLAKQLIDDGELGEIRHFRAHYHQEWLVEPTAPVSWRLRKDAAGTGALGDLGSHIVDQARYLVGEIASVSGLLRTFVTDRPGGRVDVDDAFSSAIAFENGAIGTLEATRCAAGRQNGLWFEVNGAKGTLSFDLERLGELQVHLIGSAPGAHAQGFRRVLVSEAYHPYGEHGWPPGHAIGWEDSFVYELLHLLTAIREDGDVGPHGATFEDGYRCAAVCDAIVRAAETGRRQEPAYRGL